MTIKGALEAIASKLGFTINAEPSHSDVRKALSAALEAEGADMPVWIDEVFSDHFVFTSGSSEQLWSRRYTVDPAGAVSLVEGATKVQRVTEFIPVTANKEGQGMKAKIDALIANSKSRFAETDRAWLETLTEDQLAKLEPVEDKAPTTHAAGKPENGAEAQTAEEPKPKAEPTVHESLDTKAAKVKDPELRSFLQSQLAAHRARKQALVDALSTNSRCAFTKERLATFEIADLEAIAKSCEMPEADYSGVPGPTVHKSVADEMPEPPVI